MTYRLFLDDERLPKDVKWIELPLGPWQIVRSYDAFVQHVTRHGLPTHVSFDHDLADTHYADVTAVAQGRAAYPELYEKCREKTGYHAAMWLAEYCVEHQLPLPTWTVHSMNPIGRENIESVLRSAARVLPTLSS